MGYIKNVKIGSNTHLIEPSLFATTSGTAGAYTATIANFELATGVVITLKIHTTNSVGANLNINNTTAINIRYNGTEITAGLLVENGVYSFVYDGTYWNVITDHVYSQDVNKNAVFPADVTVGNYVKLSANTSDECLDFIFI